MTAVNGIAARSSAQEQARSEAMVGQLPYAERIPRRRGATAFDEPWENRVLSLAIALSEAGCYPWAEFQSELIAAITAWERANPDAEGWNYFDHVTTALQVVAERHGWATDAEVATRTLEVLRTPANQHHHPPSREPVTIDTYHG